MEKNLVLIIRTLIAFFLFFGISLISPAQDPFDPIEMDAVITDTVMTNHQIPIGDACLLDTLMPVYLGGNTILPILNYTQGFTIGTCNYSYASIKTDNKERMRFLPGGNVGIGTVDPKAPLHIKVPSNNQIYTPALILESFGNKILINAINVGAGYGNWEISPNDASFLWTDGMGPNGANANSDFVIGPASSGHFGSKFTSNGALIVGKPDNINEKIFKLDVAGNIHADGGVAIGTTTFNAFDKDFKLSVNGMILAKGMMMRVEWADFVLRKDYALMPLLKVEDFIGENGHLPGIPSEEDIEKKGMEIGQTQTIFLIKIEELMLYSIDLQKQVDLLKAEVSRLANELNKIKNPK